MSHLTKIEISISNIPALKKAIKKLGGEFKQDQKEFTFWMGQKGTCVHAASFPNCKFELGIVKGENKREYGLEWDSFSTGGLSKVLGSQAEKLKQQYALFAAKDAAIAQGYTTTEKVLQDGTIQLSIAV
jgi:hypothetical protein